MKELICPSCEKPIMSVKRVVNLLRSTTSKVLVGNCLCGVAYEIHSPTRNVLTVSTSSGKRSEQFIEEGKEQ